MLGGTASCSWVTFELSWKTVKGRACVSVKRRIQAHRNPESSLRFCSVPFQFHTVEEGAACLLQLSGASSESWIKLQVFWKLCLQWAPWFDLVLNYFLPQITFEEVNTYWESGCAAANPEAGGNDFSISEGLGCSRCISSPHAVTSEKQLLMSSQQ